LAHLQATSHPSCLRSKTRLRKRQYRQIGRVSETVSIKEKIKKHLVTLEDNISAVDVIFDNHIWVDQDLKLEVVRSYQTAKEHTEKLLKRAEKLVEGFKSLPVEEPIAIINDSSDSDNTLEGELV